MILDQYSLFFGGIGIALSCRSKCLGLLALCSISHLTATHA